MILCLHTCQTSLESPRSRFSTCVPLQCARTFSARSGEHAQRLDATVQDAMLRSLVLMTLSAMCPMRFPSSSAAVLSAERADTATSGSRLDDDTVFVVSRTLQVACLCVFVFACECPVSVVCARLACCWVWGTLRVEDAGRQNIAHQAATHTVPTTIAVVSSCLCIERFRCCSHKLCRKTT